MGAIASTQIKQVTQYPAGTPAGETMVQFFLSGITTADTLDLSATIGGIPAFSRLKAAVWIPIGDGGGGADNAGILGTLGNGATGVNNKITFTLTSLSNGCAAVMAVGTP